MAFIEDLRKARGERPLQSDGRKPFIEVLRESSREGTRRSADPWRLRLERVRGDIGYDGIERITTQTLFDLLEIRQGERHAGACRHLAKLMRELGWTSMKTRSLAQSGFRDQVRGYARDTRASTRRCTLSRVSGQA